MPIPIERISVCNLLSFGESAEPLDLRPLNVLIGINGSGKSNLIETIALLASMNSPRGMSGFIGQSGGILNWLWKGTEAVPIAKLDVSGGLLDGRHFEHQIAFTRVEQSIEAVDESVSVWPQGKRRRRKPLFSYENGVPVLRYSARPKPLSRQDINFTQSILREDQPAEIAYNLSHLSRLYRSFRIYRMSNIDNAKHPQQPDLPSGYLIPDATNLGAVLRAETGTQLESITRCVPVSTSCPRLGRFGLLELRVFQTFLDNLRPICSGPGYPGDAPTVGDRETVGRRGRAGQEGDPARTSATNPMGKKTRVNRNFAACRSRSRSRSLDS